MSLKVQAVNLALVRIGHDRTITDLEEKSREAFTAALLIDHEFKATLRSHPWPFATKYLTLVVEDGTAEVATNPDWQYAYVYPADCVMGRRMVTGAKRKFETNPPVWRVGRLHDKKVIYTDLTPACLEYTAFFDCPEHLGDELFVDAFAWRIAASLAPSLSRIANMSQTALGMFALTLDAASATSEKEQHQEDPGEARWIQDRD